MNDAIFLLSDRNLLVFIEKTKKIDIIAASDFNAIFTRKVNVKLNSTFRQNFTSRSCCIMNFCDVNFDDDVKKMIFNLMFIRGITRIKK